MRLLDEDSVVQQLFFNPPTVGIEPAVRKLLLELEVHLVDAVAVLLDAQDHPVLEPLSAGQVVAALRGLTNEDSSEVQLIGRAVVVREASTSKLGIAEPRMEYRGEFLHAFMNTERVRSHKPVEFLRGQDRFSADSLDFDNVEQILQLNGRVRATLTPASTD